MTSANQKPSRTTDSANAGWLRRLVRLRLATTLEWLYLIFWVLVVINLTLVVMIEWDSAHDANATTQAVPTQK